MLGEFSKSPKKRNKNNRFVVALDLFIVQEYQKQNDNKRRIKNTEHQRKTKWDTA